MEDSSIPILPNVPAKCFKSNKNTKWTDQSGSVKLINHASKIRYHCIANLVAFSLSAENKPFSSFWYD